MAPSYQGCPDAGGVKTDVAANPMNRSQAQASALLQHHRQTEFSELVPIQISYSNS
jgi:hypothetical protein